MFSFCDSSGVFGHIYVQHALYILHYIRVTHCPSPKLMVLQPLWVAVICCLSELFYSLFSFLLLPTSHQQKNKAHGTTATPPQDNLKWGCDPKTADNICCFNRHYAEHSGYVIYIPPEVYYIYTLFYTFIMIFLISFSNIDDKRLLTTKDSNSIRRSSSMHTNLRTTCIASCTRNAMHIYAFYQEEEAFVGTLRLNLC